MNTGSGGAVGLVGMLPIVTEAEDFLLSIICVYLLAQKGLIFPLK